MPKKDPLQETLSELNRLRDNSSDPDFTEALRTALGNKSSHLVARAAQIVSEDEITGLESELAAAFERFLEDPMKTDPGCSAKAAIAEALYLNAGQSSANPVLERVFLRGVRFIQLEPVYGGKQDMAGKLRAYCGMGLAETFHPQALILLADLLADPVLDARLGAVRALGSCGQAAAIPLLRLKGRLGDDDPRLMYEIFRALLVLDPENSLELVAGSMTGEREAEVEAAALALGESHLEAAFPYLQAWCQGKLRDPELSIGLTALALLRSRRAVDYLIFLVSDGPATAARQALQTLDVYRDDKGVWKKVEKAKRTRTDL